MATTKMAVTSTSSSSSSGVERTVKLSDIIQKQAVLNISTAGHVSHGKSTTIYNLTGTRTQRHRSEIQNSGKTINLGYANAKIFYCPKTGLFKSAPSTVETYQHPDTGDDMILVKHISFVDCPGHDEYMATMVGGTSVADMSILVIAGNESVPQPQTYEHIHALTMSDIPKFLILHNKLDLLTLEQATKSISDINDFLKGSPIEGATIVPVSAERGYNMEHVCRYLCFNVDNTVRRDYDAAAKMTIVRSFGTNKPSTSVTELIGGVVGGSVTQGVLAVGDHVELRPGILRPGKSGVVVQPLLAKVVHIKSEANDLEYAVSGGLIGVGLSIDSGLASSNKLVGYQLGHVGTLDPIMNQIKGRVHMMRMSNGKANKLSVDENIKIVASGSLVMDATVTSKSKKTYEIRTRLPITTSIGSTVAIMRGTRLIATIDIAEGSCDYEIAYPAGYSDFVDWERPKWTVVDDIHDVIRTEAPTEDDFKYDILASNVTHRTGTDMVTLPEIKMGYAGRSTHINNITDIINALDHSADLTTLGTDRTPINVKNLILSYFKAEMSDQARFNSSDPIHMIIDRRRKLTEIKQIIRNLASRVFRCPTCKTSCKTVIYRRPREKLYFRQCLSCSAITTTPALF